MNINMKMNKEQLNEVLKGVPYKKQAISRLLPYVEGTDENKEVQEVPFTSITNKLFQDNLLDKFSDINFRELVLELLNPLKRVITDVEVIEKSMPELEEYLENMIQNYNYGSGENISKSYKFTTPKYFDGFICILGINECNKEDYIVFKEVPKAAVLGNFNCNKPVTVCYFGTDLAYYPHPSSVLKIVEFIPESKENKQELFPRPDGMDENILQIVRNTINCVHKAIEFCLPEEFVEILKNTKVKIKPNDFRFEEVEHFKTISGEPDSIYTNGVDWQHFPQENKVLFCNTKETQVRPNLTCDLLDRETWIFYLDKEHIAHFVHYVPPMITNEELEMYNRLYN